MMRALEWDEPRARYPNIWHEEMPRQLMAFDTLACRLRLGDLVAVYYPASTRHPERANRFLGIVRVIGLRHADQRGYCWVDVEIAHRFETPLNLGAAPRRVFMCCDPGWPEEDVGLFQKVFDAAVKEGWKADENERIPPRAVAPPTLAAAEESAPPTQPAEEGRAEPAPVAAAAVASATSRPQRTADAARVRCFGGADYSGDMRDPRDGTWLALLELHGDALRVVRLEATGRHGLHGHLRDPDTVLMRAEAIGLDFPFGVPLPFAERLLEGPFPDEGWWALARRLERMTRPGYLTAIQEFRESEGEIKRWTDEQVQAFSPLHRVNPDLGPMTYHGIRMIAEERSRYAVKPFESAQGRLLLEVYPGGLVRRLGLAGGNGNSGRGDAIVKALASLEHLPVTMDDAHLRCCRASRDALDAVIAARCAAVAVLSGETERRVEELSPEHPDRVRLEGWIYGLSEPAPGTSR